MKALTALLFIAVAAGHVHAQDRDDDRRERRDDIQLVCYGGAEKLTVETHSGYQWNAEKHKYEPKSTVETGKASFETAVNVSIHGDQGSIKMPKQLVPPINSGGDHGWWDLDDLIVGHDEIRARFRLNGLNKPTLTINRVSGVITVEGMIKFNGRCEQDTGHRRF
ncbi:hypothetical protein ASD15_13605 [Massilia sp. Root351]|uniref:hypothetical protein n=1 Tax=Massilia sp. Root351 TaxID=1736522 RepID=UPI00070968DE|nr:hypothetical protein [Massilia sp. Root351]KQV80919.1 hypothetical protein ASD15_13605 [Massilia sp. Root351]